MHKYIKATFALALVSTFCGCDDVTTSVPADSDSCVMAEKPSENCACVDGSWNCPVVTNCEDESPEDNCKCVDGKWVCIDICPKECPRKCDEEGRCPAPSVVCPDTCLDDCDEKGECHPQVTCPAECSAECDENGACIHDKIECPNECLNACDENGLCPIQCPSECADTCDENGQCPVKCPAECADSCDETGKCPFVCPSTCVNGCGSEEKCICPESCMTSCDANGKCKCPSSCSKTCNANGECPGYCGGELVEKIYFTFPEIDVLVPGSVKRTTTSSSVFIKTDKHTYTLETAPCADDIVLTSSKNGVVTVEKKLVSGVPKAYFKSVAKGTSVVTASLKNSDLTGQTTIHVLDLNNFNRHLEEKDKDGKYPHLYRGPIYLGNNQHTQGFDFYDTKLTYYTQRLSTNYVVPKYDTKLTGDILSIFSIDKSEKKSAELKLRNAAHGQNLIVENTTNGDYIWLANYGTLKKNDKGGYDLSTDGTNKNTEGYKLGQTISRVKWAGGKEYFPEDISDHYYYSDHDGGSYYYNFEPAIDIKNNRFAFRATYAKDNRVYVKIYNFNSVKKLTQTKVTLPHGIDGFDKNKNFVTNQKPSVMVKDMSGLAPAAEFKAYKENALLVQAFEIENGLLYTATGFGEKLAEKDGKYEYHSYIQLRVMTYNGDVLGNYFLTTANSKKEGNITYLGNKDLDAMVNNSEVYHVGYFETDGLRVSNGVVYLNLSSVVRLKKDNSTAKRHYIFAVDLKK